MSTNDKQVIFSLVNVGKVYPPKKQVLREIYLGFYYGAKIGVLGLNGSGKSSLLRIIAGVDQNYTGEVMRSKGYSVGLLEQEPQLDPNKSVKEVVEGQFKGGIHSFGLENEGVAFALDQYNGNLIPPSVIEDVERAKKEIIAGRIKVTDAMAEK